MSKYVLGIVNTSIAESEPEPVEPEPKDGGAVFVETKLSFQ